MLVRWITALPWSMMCHLRAGEDIEKELKDKLTDAELAYLVSTPHRPNTVLQTLSSIIWNSSISEDKKFRMDENLTVFADMLGASERILRTPLPVSYTRYGDACHESEGLAIPSFICDFILFFQAHLALPHPVAGSAAPGAGQRRRYRHHPRVHRHCHAPAGHGRGGRAGGGALFGASPRGVCVIHRNSTMLTPLLRPSARPSPPT